MTECSSLASIAYWMIAIVYIVVMGTESYSNYKEIKASGRYDAFFDDFYNKLYGHADEKEVDGELEEENEEAFSYKLQIV